MKRSSNNPKMREVLKEIINRNCNEPEIKSEDATAFLQRKIECLQAENKILSEQLSKEIEAKEYLVRLVAEQNESYQKTKQRYEQAGQSKIQNFTNNQKRDGSACKLQRNKSQHGHRRASLVASNQYETNKLKQKIKVLEQQLISMKKEFLKQQRKGKTYQQQILFIKQHLCRAKQQYSDIQQEMQFSRSYIKEMKSLLTQQNSEILRLKLQIERANFSLIPQPQLNISTLTISPDHWNSFKSKISRAFQKHIKQVNLRKKVQQDIITAVNQFQKAYMQQINGE